MKLMLFCSPFYPFVRREGLQPITWIIGNQLMISLFDEAVDLLALFRSLIFTIILMVLYREIKMMYKSCYFIQFIHRM